MPSEYVALCVIGIASFKTIFDYPVNFVFF